MSTNQKLKTTNMPVCMPGYAAMCLLHFVDRSLAYVVHTLVGRRSPWQIADPPDRRSFDRSLIIQIVDLLIDHLTDR